MPLHRTRVPGRRPGGGKGALLMERADGESLAPRAGRRVTPARPPMPRSHDFDVVQRLDFDVDFRTRRTHRRSRRARARKRGQRPPSRCRWCHRRAVRPPRGRGSRGGGELRPRVRGVGGGDGARTRMEMSPAGARRPRALRLRARGRSVRSVARDGHGCGPRGRLEGLPDARRSEPRRATPGGLIRSSVGKPRRDSPKTTTTTAPRRRRPCSTPRGALARGTWRLGAEQTGVSDESDGCGYPDGEGDETRRSGFKSLSAGAEDAVAWARWAAGAARPPSRRTRPSSPPRRVRTGAVARGRVGAPLDDELPRDGEDILEGAPLATPGSDGEGGRGVGGGARGGGCGGAEGARSTGGIPVIPAPRVERRATGRDRRRGRPRGEEPASPRANRSSPVVPSARRASPCRRTPTASTATSSGVGTPSRARRSLEFDPGAGKTGFGPRGDAETREQDRRKR